MPTPLVTSSAEPCVLVIFGASGDLTHRKLIPALFELSCQNRLPEKLCVLGVSRTEMSDDGFRDKMQESVRKFAANYKDGGDAKWGNAQGGFAKRLHYHVGDAAKAETFPSLCERVGRVAREHGLP